MLKQIEQMQANMMKAQEELAGDIIEGTAGGGAVVVVMNGLSIPKMSKRFKTQS
jgi:DNA-binding protein YbaB